MVMIQICNNVFQVRDEYVDTMGKIMFSYFKSYTGRLDRCLGVVASLPFKMVTRLQYEESASREDLLGAEETQVNICQSVYSGNSPDS